MATLYWGGGSGTWDGFTTTNWYTDLARTVLSTRAPSAEDDVIFDSSSNATAYTVTIANGTTVCRSCTISGPASGNVTFAGSGGWYIYGDLTLPATGLTRTFTGPIRFAATSGTQNFTTNGVTLASSVNSQGGSTVVFQDAVNVGSANIVIANGGKLDTNGKTVTCGIVGFSGLVTDSGTLTLGASTVTCNTLFLDSGLTFNAGTSSITLSGNLTANQSNALPNNVTLYNLTLTAVSRNLEATGTITCNNLTFNTPSSAGVFVQTILGNITVNGTLTISGQSSVNRYVLYSANNNDCTLTAAAVSALTDVDFYNITVAGASSPWSGTRLGDIGGNTNITFGAGANKYIAAATGSSNFSANIWSTASGGAASAADFPLPQDTVIIDNAGLNTSATLTLQSYYVKGIDASSRTNAATITGAANVSDTFNISTNITATGVTVNARGNTGTLNVTTNGKTITALTIQDERTVVLQDALTTSGAITLTSGTFDANNKNITCSNISVINSNSITAALTKTLTLGSGTIATTSGISTSGTSVNLTNFTLTATTATITASGNATFGFLGTTNTINGSITVNGASSGCTIRGNLTVANLTLTSPTTTGTTSKLGLLGNLTVTGTLTLGGGTSVTQRMLISGVGNTLTAAAVTGLTDVDFYRIAAAGAATWSGTRLGDAGGNSGITFPAAKTVYWNLAGTQNWSANGWAPGSGGTPATDQFPLPQDTAVFNDSGSAGTITLQGFYIGTLDASARTSAMTFAGSSNVFVFGDVIYGSGITSSFSALYVFGGVGTQTFTTAGKSLNSGLSINKPSGTFQHGDAYTSTSGNGISISLGTYNTQNYNVSCSNFSVTNGVVANVTFGTSTITSSGTFFSFGVNTTNLTFSGANSTINLSSTSAKSFNGGSKTFGTVSSTGGTTNPLTIAGNNTFNTLTNSASTFLALDNGSTQTVTNFTYSGASGSVVRLYSPVPGQRATIQSTNSVTFGANSTDGGNNSGVSFTGSSPDYFYVKDIAFAGPVPPSTNAGNFLSFFM